jgi:hypothetical protein
VFHFLTWLRRWVVAAFYTDHRGARPRYRLGLQEILEDRLVPATAANLLVPPATVPSIQFDLLHGPNEHASTTLPNAVAMSGGQAKPIVLDHTASASSASSSSPTGISEPVKAGLTPAEVRNAYGVGLITFGSSIGPVAGDGTGQTIAIVDAFDDPTIASDLQVFDQQFGLANPPSFTKVNEYGNTSNLPGVDPSLAYGDDWETEESLDVEWAHAIAPGANIILVESNTNSRQDLKTAVQTAGNLPGVSVVSTSWGANDEFNSELSNDEYFTTPTGHSAVTVVNSSGDGGSATLEYPDISPDVVSVGGTVLTLNGTETAWADSTGGTSKHEREPAYQEGVQSTGFRSDPDVSMVGGAPGVPIYDSYDYQSNGLYTGSWSPVGWFGTSLSCVCWAGLIAIADQGRAQAGEGPLNGATQTLPALYSVSATDYHDITTGSNGKFKAGPGYDEVTGLGSPVANELIPDLAAMSFLPDGTAGQPYAQTITEPARSTVTFSLTNPTSKVTPASLGLDLTVSGNELAINGIPKRIGTFGFEVITRTGTGTTTQLESLTVNPDLSLTAAALPAGRIGTHYNQTIAALGGSGTVKVTAAVTGAVKGLALSIKGTTVTVVGTPTVDGTFTFQVNATDAYGTISQGYTITVGLGLSPATLPEAAVGVPYSQTISAGGGLLDSRVTQLVITSTTVPTDLGLTITPAGPNVTITGTPTATGTITFNVVVTEYGGFTINYYTMAIGSAGPPSIATNPASVGIDAGLSVRFTAAAAAAGGSPPTVQWQVSTAGGPFTNLAAGGVYGNTVTTPTLFITGASAALNGNQYQAVFTNTAGTATTTPATLTVDAPVAIKGTASHRATGTAAVHPFSTVVVTNARDPAELLDVEIILIAPANGTLSNLGGGTYDPAEGIYFLSGVTAAQAQAALRALEFLPQANTTKKTVTTTFTLAIANLGGTDTVTSTVSIEP